MGRQKEGKISATWDTNDVMIFCDLCLKEIELGNRLTTYFSKDGWKNLTVNFQERTGKLYDRAQMKNKWDQLKKEWRLWRQLKQGERDLGWNPSRKTIDASDEWWDKRLEVVPTAKKFRYAGISPDLEEKLDMMFNQLVATGDHAWVRNSGNIPLESVDEHVMSDADNYMVKDQSIPIGMSDNTGCSAPTTTIHRVSTTSRKRRTIKGKEKVAETKQEMKSTLDELVETTRSVSRKLMEPDMSSTSFTIPETVEELGRHPEIYDDLQFFDFATVFLMETPNRETFMSLPGDRKVWWLRNRYMNRSK